MEQRPSPALKYVLLEAGLVVLGVVLAFAANEWRENRLASKRGELALQSIRNEFQQNRSALLESKEYHTSLMDTLGSMMASERGGRERIPEPRVFARGFVNPATLLTTAWDVANATDVLQTLDYDIVLSASRVYAAQRAYERQSAEVGQLIYATLFHEGREAIYRNYRNLFSILATFAYRECQLLSQYDSVLSELGVKSEPRSDPYCERMTRRL